MHVSTKDLQQMDSRYRASMVNSLGGFKSVVMIGTLSSRGQTNLAIFNSLIHLGANPALCAFIVRPDVSPRHTLFNIIDTKYYTINHLTTETYKKAHQTSARYPAEESEYTACGLTESYLDDFHAPFVAESNIKFGCEYKQHIPIELNGTTLIIGEITQIYYPVTCQAEDGFIDIEKAGSITVSGLDSYHTTQKLARLSYAKTDKLPSVI